MIGRASVGSFAVRRNRAPVFRALAVAAALSVAIAVSGCSSGNRALSAIRVGVPPLEQNALLYIAQQKDFFTANGLAVSIMDYDSGAAALDALKAGAVDIAETAEFPFVVRVLGGAPLRILATNDLFENDYLVAPRGAGISGVQDLKGKRIGVTLGAITEFYLGRFLALNKLRPEDVSLVNVSPPEFTGAIASGRVDALVAWQPFVSRIVSPSPADFTVLSVQSSQPVYGILVSTSSWMDGNVKLSTQFLKALAQAEDFLLHHPEESQDIVAKRLSYDKAFISSVWPKHAFSLRLDFSLVAAMEGEARWYIERGEDPAGRVPDFVKFMEPAGLVAIKPEGVNLMQ